MKKKLMIQYGIVCLVIFPAMGWLFSLAAKPEYKGITLPAIFLVAGIFCYVQILANIKRTGS